MSDLWVSIAQRQPQQQFVDQAIWNLGLIAVGAVVLIGAAMIVYRYFNRQIKVGDGQPFTLTDLRRMHREGQLTNEEFERAKALMIARGRASLRDSGTGPAFATGETDKAASADSDKAPDGPHCSEDR